jgi:serine/threonine protein kinase
VFLVTQQQALGCLLYEMIGGENPFFYEGVDNLSLFNDICSEQPYPLPEDKTASDEVRDLIDRLLVKDETQRIGSMAKGSREIKMHPWFDDVDLELARERKLEAPFKPAVVVLPKS